MAQSPVRKVCIACQSDVSSARRFRARDGRYLCIPCWERAKIAAAAMKEARSPVPAGPADPRSDRSNADFSRSDASRAGRSDAGMNAGTKAGTNAGTRAGTNAAGLTGTHADPGGSTISDFLDGASSLVFNLGSDTSNASALACPSCREPWTLDSVVCINCGYNRAAKVEKAAKATPVTRSWSWQVAPRLIAIKADSTNRLAAAASFIGAAFGVIMWATVASATGIEAEFMALFVGASAGLAVSFLVHRLVDRTTGLIAATFTAFATLPGHYVAGLFILGRQGLAGLPPEQWLPRLVTPWSGLACVAAIWIAFRLGKRLPKIPMKNKPVVVGEAKPPPPTE